LTAFGPARHLRGTAMRLTRGVLVVAVLVVPEASLAQTKPVEPPAAVPATPPLKRIFLDVGLAGSSSSLAKNRNFLGYFVKYGEVGSTTVNYPKPSRSTLAPALDLGGGFMLRPDFALGVSYNRVSYEDVAGLTTTAPHPTLLSTPATDSGQTSTALKRQEGTTTIYAAWVPSPSPRTQVRVFGGAAIFAYSAEMVQASTYTQNAGLTPPFNTITVDGSVNQQAKGTDLGIAAGVDFTFFITKLLGVSGGARYSRGTVTLQHEPLSQIRQDIRVGSTQILVGVRLRFGG